MSVTYSSPQEAKAAIDTLQHTKIAGNSRYIDVLSMDPQDFVAGHNIDPGRQEQFFAMSPEQQHTVMARGSLSTARDPTAVLVQRMTQVRTKGSFGPAKGSGMGKGGWSMGNGPYDGGMGKGG